MFRFGSRGSPAESLYLSLPFECSLCRLFATDFLNIPLKGTAILPE